MMPTSVTWSQVSETVEVPPPPQRPPPAPPYDNNYLEEVRLSWQKRENNIFNLIHNLGVHCGILDDRLFIQLEISFCGDIFCYDILRMNPHPSDFINPCQVDIAKLNCIDAFMNSQIHYLGEVKSRPHTARSRDYAKIFYTLQIK